MSKNPYIRIMEAAEKNVGVKLTAKEVYYMAQDASIATVATNLQDGIEVQGGSYRLTKQGFEEF